MTADEWRQIDEALDKKLEKQLENIIIRVKAMLFGETGNNGINGKCEKNTSAIVELDKRIDIIEKQKLAADSITKSNPDETEKVKIEWENKYKIEQARAKWLFLTTIFGASGFVLTLITIILSAMGVINI